VVCGVVGSCFTNLKVDEPPAVKAVPTTLPGLPGSENLAMLQTDPRVGAGGAARLEPLMDWGGQIYASVARGIEWQNLPDDRA
jgi:hypothetical protein